MNLIESGGPIQRAHEQHVFDVIENLATYPTVHGYFQDLWNHDRNSATHDLRVAIAMTHAAYVFGLDTDFAALCGILHDTGKEGVDADMLQDRRNTTEILAAIRGPHMDHLRRKVQAIPQSELDEATKTNMLAVVMSHHEFLANNNGRGPYPRATMVGDPALTPRSVPTPDLRMYQAILAFADTADRIVHGFHDTISISASDAHGIMYLILREATSPLTQIELDTYVGIVTHSVFAVTPDMVTQSFRLLRIDAR